MKLSKGEWRIHNGTSDNVTNSSEVSFKFFASESQQSRLVLQFVINGSGQTAMGSTKEESASTSSISTKSAKSVAVSSDQTAKAAGSETAPIADEESIAISWKYCEKDLKIDLVDVMQKTDAVINEVIKAY